MDTLGERVAAERRVKGWSQAELAAEVTRRGFRVGQSAIGNIEAARVQDPKCIIQLASALGVAAGWLQTGRGSKHAPEATTQPIERRSIVTASEPIVRYRAISLGAGGNVLITKEKIGTVSRPEHLMYSANALAYEVQDDEFSPILNPRDIAVIDPSRPLKPGDDCFFVSKDENEIVGRAGRLIESTPKIWRIRLFLPASVDKELTKAQYPKAWVIAVIHRA